MRTIGKFALLIFPLMLITSSAANGQESRVPDTLRTRILIVARDIMKNAGTCALITLNDEGQARVRAMSPFLPEKDFTIWFGTNPESRKVEQIKKDPRVTLYYLDNDASGYVTIYGTAQLVNDPKEKEKHWKEEWDAFYPDRQEGYLLIKVKPVWMEVLSISHDIYADPVTWQPPRVYFDSKD
ncbi:MAG: pyridoxamine 5'-phosphate oxidase family protein [Chlorobi bacterium]|nr:pyridoxamine 5'-phosphate oxidase family protein [Chlorobiota bacterium]